MRQIERHKKSAEPGVRGVLLGAVMALSGSAWAALDIAQVPLVVMGAKATPNVMYTIDESWSMAWRYMPDELKEGGATIYGNPWATGAGDYGDSNGYRWGLAFHPGDLSTCASSVCGGSSGTLNTFVARADAFNVATDLLSARLRSSSFNTIYYDPEVRYYPWYNSDGSSFPPANSKAAWLNPNDAPEVDDPTEQAAAISAGKAVNLEGEITYSSSTRWCRSNNSTTANSTTVSNATTPTCGTISGEKLAPAVYYTYNGNGLTSAANFTRVRIMDSATFTRGPGRDDCTVVAGVATCTQEQEYQNFANWFTYNRTRMFLAIAATSRAFSEQGGGLRVGYARLHQGSATVDGVTSQGTVERGVRNFSGTERDAFFTWLHALGGRVDTTNKQLYGGTSKHRFEGGTPLRQAMDDVGQYYSRDDNRGPWGADPGNDDATAHLTCRKCYNILMTDGMWTGSNSNSTGTSGTARASERRANVDNTAGSTINGPAGSGVTPYTYSPAAPYRDSAYNTLADVAMYYWNRDLRTDLANRVAPDNENPAFWQHMVNFTVGLGVKGTLDYPDDWAALQAGTKSWLSSFNANTAGAVDDLWHAAVNSRGKYFSATNPAEFAEGLSEILQTVQVREEASSTAIAANSTQLNTGTLIFQARFNSSNWSGQLLAYNLNTDGTVNQEIWDTSDSGRIPAADQRNIFTAVGVQGTKSTTAVDFTTAQWDSLSSEQRGQLNNDADTAANADATYGGKARLEWLRGVRDKEIAGGFRVRAQVLGDIINSDPYFVGATEDQGFSALPSTEGSSYAAYLTNTVASGGKSDRRSMLYVGANDGMLHGFDAQTGDEIFGYVPLGVYPNLYKLTDPLYSHTYYVDGASRASDAYISNAWRTILVGSTGAGGRSVFALDVTNPDDMEPEKLLWEFSTAAAATDKLGVAMSMPVIARLKSGDKWVAIFGNGYESGDNVKLFVVDLATGDLIRAIDTGVSGTNNGLSSVVPVDVDRDRITDYVYGGDLAGNLWKFDLRDATSTNWTSFKLFQATDAGGNAQPITARPVVGRHPTSGLMVYFGTGKFFETADASVPATPQIQTFYGIRDTNTLVARASLTQQTIDYEGIYDVVNDADDAADDVASEFAVRVVSNNAVGSSGWYINLAPPPGSTGVGERSVSTPLLRFGRVIFTTIIPNNDPCGSGGKSWLMEVDAITGGRLPYAVLDVNNDGRVDEQDFVKVGALQLPISGKGLDVITDTPAVVGGSGGVEYKYQSDTGVTTEKAGLGGEGRQSWRQLQ